jgi:hypothetical protein
MKQPMAAMRGYIDAFNRGDRRPTSAAFAAPGSILDGMAPHAGAVFTVALRRTGEGWRIAARAWAKGKQ